MNSNSLVLSEVHVGAAASHARTGVVSRFVVPFGPSIAEANHDSADVPSFVANRQRKRRSGSEPHAQDSSLNRVSAQAKSCSGKRNSAQDATERSIVVDADGDVDVPRRRKAYASLVLCISHAMATPLESVGLQVWSAALLVGDWLLQQRDDQQAAGMHMLELGAGTGLVSCLAARVCGARVYCTETGEAVLANCLDNAERNRGGHGHVIVRELDWRRIERHPLIKGASRRQSAGRDARFEWQQQDIDDVLNNTSLILGADCERCGGGCECHKMTFFPIPQ